MDAKGVARDGAARQIVHRGGARGQRDVDAGALTQADGLDRFRIDYINAIGAIDGAATCARRFDRAAIAFDRNVCGKDA